MSNLMGHHSSADTCVGGGEAPWAIKVGLCLAVWCILLIGLPLSWPLFLLVGPCLYVGVGIYQYIHLYYPAQIRLPRPRRSPRSLTINLEIAPMDSPWWIWMVILALISTLFLGCLVWFLPSLTPLLHLHVNDVIGMMAFSSAPTSSLDKMILWLFDTGCGRHMSRDAANFVDLKPIDPIRINGIGGFLWAKRQGTYVGLAQAPDGSWQSLRIHNVLLVPELPVPHLFSWAQARRRGVKADINSAPYLETAGGQRITMHQSDKGMLHVAICSTSSGTQRLNHLTHCTAFLGDTTLRTPRWPTVSYKDFHAKFGHANPSKLHILAKMFRLRLTGSPVTCEVCSQTKTQRGDIARTTTTRSDKVGGRIFVDMVGPFPRSSGGNKYAMVLVDDYSRFSWIRFCPNKLHPTYLTHLRHFHVKHPITILRSDNEFNSDILNTFCAENGITQEFTPPHTPEYNGVVERRIAVLRTVAMSYLVNAAFSVKLRGRFWTEAFNHANATVNLWPTEGNANQSPSVLAQLPIRLPSFTFGSVVYRLSPTVRKSELDIKGRAALYLGESPCHPEGTIRVVDAATQQVFITKDYKGHDNVFMTPTTPLDDTIPWLVPVNWSLLDSDSLAFLDATLPSPPSLHVDDCSGSVLIPPIPGIPYVQRPRLPDDPSAPSPAIMSSDSSLPSQPVSADPSAPSPAIMSSDSSLPSHPVSPTSDPASSPVVTLPDPVTGHPDPRSIRNVAPRKEAQSLAFGDHHAGASRGKRSTFRHNYASLHSTGISAVPPLAHAVAPATREAIFLDGFSQDTALLAHLDLPADLLYEDLTNHVDDPHSDVEFGAYLSQLPDPSDLQNHSGKILTPKTYKQALASPEAAQWQAAMDAEMQAHADNITWALALLPSGKKAVGSRWVFALKLNPDGSVKRFKARLVAQGFTQVEGVDYTETFAPVVALTTVRLLISTAAAAKWFLHQMDVETAFLQAPIQEEVYVAQAPGYFLRDEMGRLYSYRLHKSLYGLKQSPFNWNVAIHEFLTSADIGFVCNDVDRCLYTKTSPTGQLMILTIYVDDLILTGDWTDEIAAFKLALLGRFKIQDLGRLEHCLGFNVHYPKDGSILLNQVSYIDQLILKFNMQDAFTTATPAVGGIQAYQVTDSQVGEDPSQFPYAQLIGSLNWIAWGSRPDIANAVRLLNKYTNQPSFTHVALAKRVLRYLKGTRDLGLHYGHSSQPHTLQAYSDSSYADNVESARSTTGYMHLLNGAPICWKSTCQTTVARSSCEAEYMSMSDATNEVIYLQNLLQAVVPHYTPSPTVLHVDNKSAIFIGNGVAPTRLSRHISVRYHNVQQAVRLKQVILQHVSSKAMKQLADILTKNLGPKIFLPMCDSLLKSCATLAF